MKAFLKCVGVGILAMALAGTALAADASTAAAELSLQKVVIALKPDKNPDKMQAEKANLERHLSAKLRRPVEVIVPLSAAVILEGFQNGTIDLGYLSGTDAVQAQDRKAGEVLLAGRIKGRTFYESYWLALKDKPYTSVEDLRGKPIAFASKTSTSGFLVPVWDLHKKGLITPEGGPEAFFGKGNVYYGVGYVSAVQRVLDGQAEAAAVSDYVFDGDKHLTPEQRASLKKVATQGPVPTHTICARVSLTDADKAALKQALLDMNTENPKLRDEVFTSELVVVNPQEHLRSVREALVLVKGVK